MAELRKKDKNNMPMDYNQYRIEIEADIANTLSEAACQPILFVGSGFSRRYFGAPNWDELLAYMAKACPRVKKDYAYFKQSFGNPIAIGGVLSDEYKEWAWEEGKDKFPEGIFNSAYPPSIFFKHKVCEYLTSITPSDVEKVDAAELQKEITAFIDMHPHAVVTTNYDTFLEVLFPDYQPIVGQKILKMSHTSIGEIFKIHGCVKEPQSIVLIDEDYKNFDVNKKYLSAKLLTYFVEHPLLFIGYKADDPNIKNILYDIHCMMGDTGLIPNIYILEYDPAVNDSSYPARDKVISIGDDISIRIKSITASNFNWVYEAFHTDGTLEKVNMKLLRSLVARTVDLVRTDVPRKTVEINFETLEHALGTGEDFAKLFGITTIDDPKAINLAYPYSITHVAESLELSHWTYVQQLISAINEQNDVDIKASDNRYHICVKTGKKSINHKYSQAAIDLLKAFASGHEYSITL